MPMTNGGDAISQWLSLKSAICGCPKFDISSREVKISHRLSVMVHSIDFGGPHFLIFLCQEGVGMQVNVVVG